MVDKKTILGYLIKIRTGSGSLALQYRGKRANYWRPRAIEHSLQSCGFQVHIFLFAGF